ncbi:MAG: ribosomal protein S18-alanine N-acetyltransferase [Mycobacteriales bacterium]
MTVAVRPMRWWDIEGLMPLERELFAPECWSAALFWSELAQADTRHYLVATEAGEVAGYAGLCVYPDGASVQTLAVRRASQGRGVGAGLLMALLAEAARRGRDVVTLEVRADNERAQALYARFGFAPVGRRRGYYQPSGTDAVVMMLRGVRQRVERTG